MGRKTVKEKEINSTIFRIKTEKRLESMVNEA